MRHRSLAGAIPAGLFSVLAVLGGALGGSPRAGVASDGTPGATSAVSPPSASAAGVDDRLAPRTIALDLDGDGRLDLVRLSRSAANEVVAEVLRSDGVGLVPVGRTTLGRWCVDGSCRLDLVAMDVDGDGRADLVRSVEVNGVTWADVWRSDGARFALLSTSRVGAARG